MASGTYHVHWIAGARDDLLAIAEYVYHDSEQAAIAVILAIEERAASLRTLPGRGRTVPELEHTGKRGYRELILTPWRIIYKVKADSVVVTAVLDGRRKVADFLLQLLAEREREPT